MKLTSFLSKFFIQKVLDLRFEITFCFKIELHVTIIF